MADIKDEKTVEETANVDDAEVTVIEGIEDELQGLIKCLAGMENATSEKYVTVLENTITLGKMWNDMKRIKCDEQKATLEHEDKEAQRKHEWKLKQAEIEARQKADEMAYKIKKMEVDAKKESDDKSYQIKQLEIIDMNSIHAKDWVEIGAKVFTTATPILAFVGMSILGWHNENHPVKPTIITSATTRQTTGILGGMVSRLGK